MVENKTNIVTPNENDVHSEHGMTGTSSRQSAEKLQNLIREDLQEKHDQELAAAIRFFENYREPPPENRKAKILSAVGCFIACWAATLLIAKVGGGEHAAKIAGFILGGAIWLITDYAGQPEIQIGAKIGNILYVLSVLGYCCVNLS